MFNSKFSSKKTDRDYTQAKAGVYFLRLSFLNYFNDNLKMMVTSGSSIISSPIRNAPIVSFVLNLLFI